MSTAVAVALRFTGLGFGRGVLTPRADEELLRSGVLISLGGDSNPHYAVWGHVFHYVYTLLAAVWMAFRVGVGQVRSWTDGLAAAHCEPENFIWIGRAISATVGVLTLVATYQLARRSLGSRLVAACACVLLSTLFLHVRDSHFATSDVLLAFLCTAALAAMTNGGGPRVGWAGLWTGLALATKLLSATLVLTFACLLVAIRTHNAGTSLATVRGRLRQLITYVSVAAVIVLVTQPYLVLDPMETWFGLFGDLFNRERRPFEHGLSLTNAKIIVRYYVPQAMGWTVGGLAAFGGLRLLRQARSPRVLPLFLYVFWSLVAILSVQRIFLRYLDPLLPVTCVLAAWAIERIARLVKRQRLAVTVAITVAAAVPNLLRCFWLDHHLLRDDTRALAGKWIEMNLPSDTRVFWSGYGSIAPHITMPWWHTPEAYDRLHIALREQRGLPVHVDEAIVRWKHAKQVPVFWTVGLSFGQDGPDMSGLAAYPFLDHAFDLPQPLRFLDRWGRAQNWLKPESPRWDLMRRHVTRCVAFTPATLLDSDVEYVVVTGMPCDPEIIAELKRRYDEVQVFDPGVDWSEFGGRIMYDSGDAWYLPNWGIHRVERPGPQIMIFRKRASRLRSGPRKPSRTVPSRARSADFGAAWQRLAERV